MKMIHIRFEVSHLTSVQLPHDINMQYYSQSSVADAFEYLGRAYPHAYSALKNCHYEIAGEKVFPETVLDEDTILVLTDHKVMSDAQTEKDLSQMMSQQQNDKLEDAFLFSNQYSMPVYEYSIHPMLYQWHM